MQDCKIPSNMELFHSMNLMVQLYIDSKIDTVMTDFYDSLFHSNKDHDFLNMILNTDIGEKFKTVPIDVIDCLDKRLFIRFQGNHKRANYSKIFEKKADDKHDYFERTRKFKGQVVHHYTIDKRCQNEILPTEIRRNFRHVFYSVTTHELLGHRSNQKKILKSLNNMLITAKTEKFSLKNLLSGLNVESILWLSAIHNREQKYIVLAKFIKWLFQYFIALVSHMYHISFVKEQPVYIYIKDYKNQEKNFLRKLQNKLVIQPADGLECTNKERKMVFHIKKDGLRPILTKENSIEEKEALKKALCVLQYLNKKYMKNSKINFDKSYIEIVKKNKKSNDNKMYIISCDILNAFGSIKIDKLYEIIQDLFDKLPNKLKIIQRTNYYKKFWTYLDPEKQLAQGKNKNIIETIKKDDILKLIRDSIYLVKFTVGKKEYILCKGISQGSILSAKLCDIYYSSMRDKYFSNFEKEGFFYHFVDDSLYITKNENTAELYLEILLKGIREYNCWFNKSKIKINFDTSQDIAKSPVIDFLGFKIHSDSLEIEPNYRMSCTPINYTHLSYSSLPEKIVNITALKLQSVTLCKEINSEKQIFENIENIITKYATRCFSLINYCWNLSNKYKFPMKILKAANRKIIKQIFKYTKWDGSERHYCNKMITFTIWKALHQVFIKKKDTFPNEVMGFKNLMISYKKSLGNRIN